jgi:hypothetical protein
MIGPGICVSHLERAIAVDWHRNDHRIARLNVNVMTAIEPSQLPTVTIKDLAHLLA